MKHTLFLVLLLLLASCDSTDIAPSALAITSPASGSSVSGTVTVQIGSAEDSAVTRVDLYVRGQGSTGKGVLAGSSVNKPYVVSWNTIAQPNTTNLELVAIGVDSAGTETASPPVPVRTQNTGTPQLQYLVGYTLAPRTAVSSVQTLSDHLLTEGVVVPKSVDLNA